MFHPIIILKRKIKPWRHHYKRATYDRGMGLQTKPISVADFCTGMGDLLIGRGDLY